MIASSLRSAKASLHVNSERPLATGALEIGHSKEFLKHDIRPFAGDKEVGIDDVESLLGACQPVRTRH